MPDAPPPERPPPHEPPAPAPPGGWVTPPPPPGYPPPAAPPYPGWGYPPGGSPPFAYPPPGWAPAPGPAQVGSGRFRSMGVGELLDGTFSLYRRNFVLIAAISAIVQVPFAVLTYVLYQVFDYNAWVASLNSLSARLNSGELSQGQAQDELLRALGGVFATTFILFVVAIFVVLPLAEAATTRAVSDRYLDHETSVGVSYRAALRRLGALVVQSLVLIGGIVLATALLVAVGLAGAAAASVLLAIPIMVLAVIVFVRTSLAPPAIVLEGISGIRGLRRSWDLVRGMSWRILGIRLLLGLITGIIQGVVAVLITLPGFGLDPGGRFIVQEVGSALAAVFVSPITYIGVTLLYYDARIRKEGFDIEMLARSL